MFNILCYQRVLLVDVKVEARGGDWWSFFCVLICLEFLSYTYLLVVTVRFLPPSLTFAYMQ